MQSVLANAQLASLSPNGEPYGLMANAAIVVDAGVIRWVGDQSSLPDDYAAWSRRDLGGRLVTPGLVDCHTHLVFAGDRAREFEMRLTGTTYEEIARAGGGIVATVSATRGADVAQLVALAIPRVEALINEGVTTIEIKSGYGLTTDAELNMLRAAREIGQQLPIRVVTSFLGAHVAAMEYADRLDAYIDEVCIPSLEAAHRESLVDAVDGFCEEIAFSSAQIERVFVAARDLGLPVKLHAEQLSNCGGVALAAKYGALSADHLEYASEADVEAMAAAGTVAVLLPGAFYFLRETKQPPIAEFRKHAVPMAVATDLNPGSSPLNSLLLSMNMACTLFRLTPEEALAGVTRAGAMALGLTDCGQVTEGMRADLAIFDVAHPAELSYRIGVNPLNERIFAGDASTTNLQGAQGR